MTLDDLIALNDEIAALVRAGVPLEEGLAELGRDVRGRFGKLMSRLGDDATRGIPLGEALADPSLGLPPVYRAVIEAGVRAGRLPAALESIAGAVRRLAQMRRQVAIMAFYPLLLLVVAWGLFAGFTVFVAPRLESMFVDFKIPGVAIFTFLTGVGHWAVVWGPALPLLVIVLAVIWVFQSRRALMLDAKGARPFFTFLPWFGPAMRWSHTAVFADLLATLVENRVPLHEAIRLAGEASGDPAMMQAARPLADSIERGEPVPPNCSELARYVWPPLLQWSIHASKGPAAMVSTLRRAADTYRTRAQYQADLAQLLLPVVLTVVVGGTVTLLYALAVFGPLIGIFRSLS